MSELRKNRRDVNLRLTKLLSSMGVIPDAQATSTSGRWKIILGAHTRDGLPCFDVIAVRVVDFFIDSHHFSMKDPSNEGGTYDEQRDQALIAARRFYEDLVIKMQQKAQSEEKDEDSGLEIINPDGTAEDFNIN